MRFVRQRATSSDETDDKMARTTARRRTYGAVRKLPSGRFQATYLDPTGVRRTAPTTFATKTDADAWLATTRTDIARGKWNDPQRGQVLLRDYIERWLAAPPRPLRPKTLHMHRDRARRFLLQPIGGICLGDLPLAAITPSVIREWHAALLQTTAAGGRGEAQPRQHPARIWAEAQGIELPKTGRLPANVVQQWDDAGRPVAVVRQEPKHTGRTIAAQTYRLLHAVLNTATDEQLVDTNPCRIAKAGHVRTPERTPATMEQLRMLSEEVPERYAAAVWVAAFTGLRPGELFALARRHFDPVTQVLTVERQLVDVPGQPVVFGPPKTDSSVRKVTLPATVAQMLLQHAERFAAADPDALLFTTTSGGYVTDSARSWWVRARNRVGLPDLRFYDLRHTGQTFAAQQGAGLPQLMARMGHSTTRAALVYMHATADSDRQLAIQLDSMLVGGAEVIDLAGRRVS